MKVRAGFVSNSSSSSFIISEPEEIYSWQMAIGDIAGASNNKAALLLLLKKHRGQDEVSRCLREQISKRLGELNGNG